MGARRELKRTIIKAAHESMALSRQLGAEQERERIIQRLNDYFELTLLPDDEGNVTDNPEWDNGFQAAIAIIKGEQK